MREHPALQGRVQCHHLRGKAGPTRSTGNPSWAARHGLDRGTQEAELSSADTVSGAAWMGHRDPLSATSSLTLTAVGRLGVGGGCRQRERDPKPEQSAQDWGLTEGAPNWDGQYPASLPLHWAQVGPRGQGGAQETRPQPLRRAGSRTRDRKHLDRQIQHKKAAFGEGRQERGQGSEEGVWLQVGGHRPGRAGSRVPGLN